MDYLLNKSEDMVIYKNHTGDNAIYQPTGAGSLPNKRSIEEYLKYGVVIVDKSPNPSSHEVTTWVKRILECDKTGHSGTLDPKVTGVLPICLNRATRLTKCQQNAGKTYICEVKIIPNSSENKHLSENCLKKRVKKKEFINAIEKLTGHLFQRPPIHCAVKRELRLRWIYKIKLLEFYSKENKALIEVECEAGSYIRSLCTHIGYFIGCKAEMEELRRIRSGAISENVTVNSKDKASKSKSNSESSNSESSKPESDKPESDKPESSKLESDDGNNNIPRCVTLHDLQDAQYIYKTTGNDKYLRKVIQPLESLLVHYPRIMIKDSAVNSICYGGQLSIKGVYKYDLNIEPGKTVVLITSKGEAVALVKSLIDTIEFKTLENGVITKTERVIMEKDLYPKCWGIMKDYEIYSSETEEEEKEEEDTNKDINKKINRK